MLGEVVRQQGLIVNLPWIESKTPASKVKRYDRSKKTHIDVDRSLVVGVYNPNMGGIDLFDMMSTFCKGQLKSKRWCLYISYHTLIMAMANSWFLCCRESKPLKNAKPLPMKEFQIQAATSLMSTGKMPCGLPLLQSQPPAKKHKVQPSPQLDCRYDNVGHTVHTSQEKKGGCRYCPTGFSFWTCTKCKVYLCLVCGKNPKNCFLAFHQK